MKGGPFQEHFAARNERNENSNPPPTSCLPFLMRIVLVQRPSSENLCIYYLWHRLIGLPYNILFENLVVKLHRSGSSWKVCAVTRCTKKALTKVSTVRPLLLRH